MTTCKAHDGQTVTDGSAMRLVLAHGDNERTIEGNVRAFEQDGETRWEIETGVAQWPAVGFLPENVLRVELN